MALRLTKAPVAKPMARTATVVRPVVVRRTMPVSRLSVGAGGESPLNSLLHRLLSSSRFLASCGLGPARADGLAGISCGRRHLASCGARVVGRQADGRRESREGNAKRRAPRPPIHLSLRIPWPRPAMDPRIATPQCLAGTGREGDGVLKSPKKKRHFGVFSLTLPSPPSRFRNTPPKPPQEKTAVESAVKEAEEACKDGTTGACAAAWDNVR